jgi:uncharacterized protein (TIGR02996 family)
MNAIDHKPFLDNIEENYKDDAAKLTYSDWLLENNLETAATVWKWLGITGRYPGRLNKNCFSFGNENDLEDIVKFEGSQCCLPQELFTHTLTRWYDEYSSFSKKIEEKSRVEVVQYLIKIWDKATKKRWFKKYFIPKWTKTPFISKEEAECRIKLKFDFWVKIRSDM